MARYNKKARDESRTTNHAGDTAWKLDAFTRLYTLVVTSTVNDKYYESSADMVDRLRKLVREVGDPELIGKLAIYAREVMYLRTISLVLAVELARNYSGSIVGKVIARVIQRADEITEILAYYQHANRRKGTKKLNKLSKQLQKGIAAAFNKFDEYQFAKYNRDTEIKLKDALFLTHPKAVSDEQQAIFDRLVNGTLKTPYTWETQLSEKGNNSSVWVELLDSKKLGYMALLRNLRNILNSGVSVEHVKRLCKFLTNPNAVRNSKQLPFRFLSAYREIRDNDNALTSMVLDALEDAMSVSVENIKGYDYDTSIVIACDVSGSMETQISPRSTVQMFDIGIVLGLLLQSRCKACITGMFGDTWKVLQMPKRSIIANADEMHRREGEVGYSTNGYTVLEYLIGKKIAADKVMIFTDCQLWDSYHSKTAYFNKLWSAYKGIYPGAKLYIFDLAGHGTTPVNPKGKDVFTIAGWSDKIFDILDALENKGSIVEEIKKVKV